MTKKKQKNGGQRAYMWADRPLTIRNKAQADPNQIGRALEQIAANHDGRLQPEHVVEDAKTRSHPLHPHLTWDNGEAAHKCRLQEARALIRSVVLMPVSEDEPAHRPWISVSDKDGVAYRDVDEVVSSVDLQRSIMQQALRDLEAFEQRYSELREICVLVRAARLKLARLIPDSDSKKRGQGTETRPSV